MKYASKLCSLLTTLALLAAVSDRAAGQAIQSTILGTVTDPSGAVVSGATVIVKNEGTSFERTMVTDENGDYRVAGLETGNYQVSISAPGFKTYVQASVVLDVSQIKRVDARLQLGQVSEQVTVTGGIGQLETETASLSNVKPARDFTQLPLSVFGRGWSNIAGVVAGVSSVSGFEVNGARDTANNFTSDGISVNDIVSSRQTPNGFSGEIEVIQELKVMTANNSAEYPQVAQFSAVTKSGTNELHGSLYWGNFNSVFSARAWGDPSAPSFVNHNMFAVTNGGPVYIPGLYNGRDKTFYFFSYGGARYRVGGRQFLSIPTPAFRQGDFSSLLGNTSIVDPFTGIRFPDNKIPANRISSVSKSVQEVVYPDPNLPGRGDFGVARNFTADPGGQFNSDVYSIRGDHKISNKNTLFARLGLTKTNQDKYPGALKQGYPGWLANHPGRSIVISDTHTFSPSLLNEAKLGFSRDYGAGNDFNYGQQPQTGLVGISNPENDPAIGGLPNFSFSGAIPFDGPSNWVNRWSQRQNTYQLIDNLSWYRSRHTFKVGGDFRRYQINDESKGASLRGSFNFDDQLSGLAYANFLLGLPSYAEREIARPNAYLRSSHFGFYFQDDFKMSQRITLNYGLRYEYQTPWVDKYDRLFTFDPKTGSLVTAGTSIPTDLVPAVASTLPIVTASQAGFPVRSLFEKDGNNWNPRLGLAIRPFANATTVIRLGYGMYTQIWPGLLGLNATGGPWKSTESFFIEGNQPSIQFPSPFSITSNQFSGLQSIAGLSVRFPNEQTQQWNLSIGRQIWDTAIDVSYVGTKAENIPFTQDLNQLYPSTIPYSSARRPYQRFNAVSLTQSGGSSIYHGLNIQADRRISKGLSFNANYTWAKSLSDVDLRTYSASSEQNQYQRFLERGDDPNIRRHTLRFSYIYLLPIGRGQRYLNRTTSFADLILGGWQVSGITTMLSGRRYGARFSGVDPANTNQFSGRPDRIGDGNLEGSMRDRIKGGLPIFDKAAFVVPANGRGSFGNSARNILTGPGASIWNLVLAKNFDFRERARFQFRWEMFNAFNRANFSDPNRDITGGNFGLVLGANSGRSMLFGLRLDY